jgi:predicted AAA+ superfamily ATPase
LQGKILQIVWQLKFYFCDPGLAAWLLGVREVGHLQAHPQRGALFENWVMTELLKAQCHRGSKPALYFLRDKEGHEIDALVETAPDTFHAVEIKSGETIASDFFAGLDYWRARLDRQTLIPWLVHGGSAHQEREKATVLPWNDLSPLIDGLG